MNPFEPSPLGRIPDEYISFKGSVDSREVGTFGKLPQLFERDNWRDPGDSGWLPTRVTDKSKATGGLTHQVEQEPLLSFQRFDGLFHGTKFPFPPLQSGHNQIQELATLEFEYRELNEHHEEKPCPCSMPTHDVVADLRSWDGEVNARNLKTSTYDAVGDEVSHFKLSTVSILRLGGERFIQSCSSLVDRRSVLSHPYGSSFSALSDSEAQDVELVQTLLLSADKVGQQQFERASKLLNWCDALSSSTGNPVQRLVHFFSKALQEKINRETGRITLSGLGKRHISDIEAGMMMPNLTMIAIHQELPFSQVAIFAGMQALVDSVADAKKVHIIDLAIRYGVQCTILMQALASRAKCPVEHLKITAIGTKLKNIIEETGDRLMSFARSINLSFSFNVVMVGDMLDFNEDLLDLDPEESVAVYSYYSLWSMIAHQDRLESVMKVIKNINPQVMVVSEAAANLNSPIFVNRFIEALFFYGAFFDSLEDCMNRDNDNRSIAESMYFNKSIQTILAAEGEERTIRHVKLNVWRKFFAQFGMVEVELSMSSVYQANLMKEKFSCGSSCTFDMDEKCLIIGWKGTPIGFVSAWKF